MLSFLLFLAWSGFALNALFCAPGTAFLPVSPKSSLASVSPQLLSALDDSPKDAKVAFFTLQTDGRTAQEPSWVRLDERKTINQLHLHDGQVIGFSFPDAKGYYSTFFFSPTVATAHGCDFIGDFPEPIIEEEPDLDEAES
jgi:hypothetical protein